MSRLARSPKSPWFMLFPPVDRVPRYLSCYLPTALKPKTEQLVRAFLLPLCTRVRGREILRASP